MGAPIGTCKLCLADDVLLRGSHVIPAWAYRFLRDEREGENPNPVLVENRRAVQTSKPVKEYMLCGPCEQKLGVYDNEVSKLAFNSESFPALKQIGRELSRQGSVQIVEPGTLDAPRLAYFACSVVWRGHSAASVPECRLGPLAEPFRKYLNGEKAPPSTVQVTLSLLRDDEPDKPQLGRIVTTPLTRRDRPHFSHEFVLCGMYFTVRTGTSRSEVERSLLAPHPLFYVVGRADFWRWLGDNLTGAQFVGRKFPRGSE